MTKLQKLTRYFTILSITSILTVSCVNPKKVGDSKQTVEVMGEQIAQKFGDVPNITIEKWIELKKENSNAVLVDVRTQEERDISMIPGAISKNEFLKNLESYKGRPIVSYCTIGGRSSGFTKELKTKNFEAYNLKESILGWTHRNFDLVDPKTGEKTKKVHVNSEAWNMAAPGYQAVWE